MVQTNEKLVDAALKTFCNQPAPKAPETSSESPKKKKKKKKNKDKEKSEEPIIEAVPIEDEETKIVLDSSDEEFEK